MIRSDAFRSLSSAHKDIWLFILTLRRFGKDAKGNNDYTNLLNRDALKAPAIAIQDFFNGPTRGMKMLRYNANTIRRAFRKFMEVGFLGLKYQGGNGPGDQSVYQIEDRWKQWKRGDPPCFEKPIMGTGKGFCQPGSGMFYGGKNEKGVHRYV